MSDGAPKMASMVTTALCVDVAREVRIFWWTACLGNERDEIQRNCDMKGGGDLPCVPCASCASCASCAAAACQARVQVQVQVRTGPKHMHVREWLNRLHRSGIISNLSQFTVEECNTN